MITLTYTTRIPSSCTQNLREVFLQNTLPQASPLQQKYEK